jgi:predicted ferric reductase
MGFVALALMSIALVAGTRSRAVEPFFGPLDRAIAFHRVIGPAALLALLAHMLLLVPFWLSNGFPLGDLFIPFHSEHTRSLDILTTYGLFLLGALAYARWLSYETWRALHRLTGPLFLATAIHLFLIEGSLRQGDGLRLWTVLLVAVGGAAWLYRVALFRRLGPRHGYLVERVTRRGHDTLDLMLKPADRRMIWSPGAFLFVEIAGLPGLHPFSIASSPVDRLLRLSIREVGDFTRALPQVAPGTKAVLYGPYGGFTPNEFVGERRLLWIGAGIGITPFLAMLAFEQANNDFRRIWLTYVARTADDAPYDAEIRAAVPQADSYIDYALWLTAERGRPTATALAAEAAAIGDYAVMLCGPRAFLGDMRRQFRALGVPDSRIIAEEFDIR